MLGFKQVFQREPNQLNSSVNSAPPKVSTVEASDVLKEPVSTTCSSVQRRLKHVLLVTALVNETLKRLGLSRGP